MSDFEKILLTAAMTVLGGFIIHSISQLFLKLFIEPLQEYRKKKSEAISLLSFYSNMLSSRIHDNDTNEYRERHHKAQDEIRMCMSNLKAAYYSISPQWFAILIGVIPNPEKFKIASNNLLTLSFLGALNSEGDSDSKNFNLAKDTAIILGAEL